MPGGSRAPSAACPRDGRTSFVGWVEVKARSFLRAFYRNPSSIHTSGVDGFRKKKRVKNAPFFGRGRDASYLAPPARIRTCSFPAYGSYLGSNGNTTCLSP